MRSRKKMWLPPKGGYSGSSGSFGGGRPTGGGRSTGVDSRSYENDRSSRTGNRGGYRGNDDRDFNREGRDRRFGSGGGGGGGGVCYAYQEGNCTRGASCRFAHEEGGRGGGRGGDRGVCYDNQNGRCDRGNTCKFSHEDGGGDRNRRGGDGRRRNEG